MPEKRNEAIGVRNVVATLEREVLLESRAPLVNEDIIERLLP